MFILEKNASCESITAMECTQITQGSGAFYYEIRCVFFLMPSEC